MDGLELRPAGTAPLRPAAYSGAALACCLLQRLSVDAPSRRMLWRCSGQPLPSSSACSLLARGVARPPAPVLTGFMGSSKNGLNPPNMTDGCSNIREPVKKYGVCYFTGSIWCFFFFNLYSKSERLTVSTGSTRDALMLV